MTEKDQLFTFLLKTKESFLKGKFIKITIGKTRNKSSELLNIYIRPVLVKTENLLSFTFRYKNKDITQNYQLEPGIIEIQKALDEAFLQANLFTTENDFQLFINLKGNAKMISGKPTQTILQEFSHDRIKKRLIKTENNIYLRETGITGQDDKVIPSMVDKFKQINRYVEIISHTLENLQKNTDFTVIDMGAGKGYLTFALYDYLNNTLNVNAQVTGVEMRDELVNKCNLIAEKGEFTNLRFVCANINDFQPGKTDMLIALHACDTATDDAIARGISANARYIVVAPCCHKQIRKEMSADNVLEPMLKHGVFMERQAEMVTDSLRSLYLELFGYQTKVFEFISNEHTPKNVMITAVKTSRKVDEQRILNKIHQIKAFFGIGKYYLESLLRDNHFHSEMD